MAYEYDKYEKRYVEYAKSTLGRALTGAERKRGYDLRKKSENILDAWHTNNRKKYPKCPHCKARMIKGRDICEFICPECNTELKFGLDHPLEFGRIRDQCY